MKIGGPVYRIGVGGGAASSVAVQGGDARDHALDFGAVQRGLYIAKKIRLINWRRTVGTN